MGLWTFTATRRPAVSVIVLLTGIVFVAGESAAVDFIRGDANNDGRVSLSDAHFITNYLFRGGPYLHCLDFGDTDDDGVVRLTDAVRVFQYLVDGDFTPPPPFPGPGPDPTPDELDVSQFSGACSSYGTDPPLRDPAAKLEILEAEAIGGGERRVTITIALSSTKPVGAYYGKLVDEAGVIEDFRSPSGSGMEDLHPWDDDVFPAPRHILHARGAGGEIHFGYLIDMTTQVEIPGGVGVPALKLHLCLKPGTPAGEYPLRFEAGELTDSQSGRAIAPELVSGPLVVHATVGSTGCSLTDPVSPQDSPSNILFKLKGSSGVPGGLVAVPFQIGINLDGAAGFSFSVDFDEEVLAATEVVRLWERPSGTPYEFQKFEIDNTNASPGNAGVDEGFVAGAAIFSLSDTQEVLPPRKLVSVLDVRFRVRPEAPLSSTEVRFLDGAVGSEGVPVRNKLLVWGREVTPGISSSFVLVNALVNIVPDVTSFVRGDSNGDLKVDVSDPVTTLSYLFLEGDPPRCLDAADANDDGKLDISDPVATLEALFLGKGSLPPPAGWPGEDPTLDGLVCGGS